MPAIRYDDALFAAAALAYLILLILLLLSRRTSAIRVLLAGVCTIAIGSSAISAFGWSDVSRPSGGLNEFISNGSWVVFSLYLLRQQLSTRPRLFRLLSWVGIPIALASLAFILFSWRVPSSAVTLSPSVGDLSARLALGVYGLTLAENLYRNTSAAARWHINLLCIALGGIFAYSILLYADALLFHRISPVLWSARPVVLIAALPLLAVTTARNRDWAIDIHVSRVVVFHTATLIGGGIFLLALALAGQVLRTLRPGWGDVAEVTLLIGGITVLGVVLSSGSARSRLRRFLSDNFFSHRFDYRREWLKSIEMLSAAHSSVQTRAIAAVAEIADSPAGLLWVRDIEGSAYQWAGSWNHAAVVAAESADSPFIGLFRDGAWVVQLDQVANPPGWLDAIDRAWIAVPLLRQSELIGFIVLTRPRAPTQLNRESFDLLRIIGRQTATHIAEQRYAQTVLDMRQLHEFSNRFAFVVHDIKNVVSQLGLIIQNAEHHLHNPEFHEDVLATVRASVDRMNRMLARLRPRDSASAEGLIAPLDLIQEEIAALRGSQGVVVDVTSDGGTAVVAMDADAFRSVIAHLCKNAVDASDGHVELRLRHDSFRVEIEIADQGSGMPAEFVRDELFKPFRSSKGDGFGIGAYQARELIRAAGGDVLVSSRPGTGTIMRILLPCVGQGSVAGTLRHGAEVTG